MVQSKIKDVTKKCQDNKVLKEDETVLDLYKRIQLYLENSKQADLSNIHSKQNVFKRFFISNK